MNRRALLGLLTSAAAVTLPSPGQPTAATGLDLAAPGSEMTGYALVGRTSSNEIAVLMRGIVRAAQIPECLLFPGSEPRDDADVARFYEFVQTDQDTKMREVLWPYFCTIARHEFEEEFGT